MIDKLKENEQMENRVTSLNFVNAVHSVTEILLYLYSKVVINGDSTVNSIFIRPNNKSRETGSSEI